MSKKRGLLVWGLLVLATIVLFVSSLTVWSKRQLLDSDAWADSSSQLLANDQVRGAVAQTLVDRLFERSDVDAQLRARLPEQAQGAAPVSVRSTRRGVRPSSGRRARRSCPTCWATTPPLRRPRCVPRW